MEVLPLRLILQLQLLKGGYQYPSLSTESPTLRLWVPWCVLSDPYVVDFFEQAAL
jgi:hypothetical protein